MKKLPKEFQFKCDEHSKEQCEKLGIDIKYLLPNCYCLVEDLKGHCGGEHKWTDKNGVIEIISLSDYLEQEETFIYENDFKATKQETTKPHHSELIVQLSGMAMQGMLSDARASGNPTQIVSRSVLCAEEMLKQLEAKGYLK